MKIQPTGRGNMFRAGNISRSVIGSRQEWTSSLKPLSFGTSGLRDEVRNMTDMEVYINTRGFVRFLSETGKIRENDVFTVVRDLRPSSERIMSAVAQAIQDEAIYKGIQLELDLGGKAPTPAGALRGQEKNGFCVVVTGSHIPFDMNGIKYYLRSGEEFLKEHEAGTLSSVAEVRKQEYSLSWEASVFNEQGMFKSPPKFKLGKNEKSVIAGYKDRCVNGFPPGMLGGKTIVHWQHSAVGRDVMKSVLRSLGATVKAEDRSEEFVPVDTEKINPEMAERLAAYAKDKPFAVVFTDGDGDRPGFADEKGVFLSGDKLGLLVAKSLLQHAGLKGKRVIPAMPISTNYGVIKELRKNGIKEIIRTSIGSPHVIKAMNDELAIAREDEEDPPCVFGWEANGGFLLGSDVRFDGAKHPLSRLATRDSILPILAVLRFAGEGSVSDLIKNECTSVCNHTGGYEGLTMPVSEGGFGLERKEALGVRKGIVEMLTPKLSDKRIISVDFTNPDYISAERRIMRKLEGRDTLLFRTETIGIDAPADISECKRIKDLLERFFTPERTFEAVAKINILDGIQVIFANAEVSHLRPSGNDPVFRNYAMAEAQDRAFKIAEIGVKEIIPDLAREVIEKGGKA